MRRPTALRQLIRAAPLIEIEAAKVGVVEAGKFHQENFRAAKWTDTGTSWKARKDGDKGRALLVGDGRRKTGRPGRLRAAATSGRSRGNNARFVLPHYGKVHNEGLKAGRGDGFIMPKRQFLGKSRILAARFGRKTTILINRRLSRL